MLPFFFLFFSTPPPSNIWSLWLDVMDLAVTFVRESDSELDGEGMWEMLDLIAIPPTAIIYDTLMQQAANSAGLSLIFWTALSDTFGNGGGVGGLAAKPGFGWEERDYPRGESRNVLKGDPPGCERGCGWSWPLDWIPLMCVKRSSSSQRSSFLHGDNRNVRSSAPTVRD